MAQEFKESDRVEWDTPQGKTRGVVKEKLTSRTEVGGQTVAASDDDPRYLVETEKSGKEAAHKPDALKGLKAREWRSMAKSDEQVMEEFDGAVNMTGKELEEWLQTDESKSVGQSDDGGESKGHESGRRIVEILEKDEDDYTDDDLDHMRKVVSYVHRHQAQRPGGDVEDSRWRYSLMNWGHDPLK